MARTHISKDRPGQIPPAFAPFFLNHYSVSQYLSSETVRHVGVGITGLAMAIKGTEDDSKFDFE